MQSNVTVPASGSKFKLWLLIVVLAVAIFGGVAYGYSWYKSNEPPPSLEMNDGSGLQGLMRIEDGGEAIKGFAKFEEKDIAEFLYKDCLGGAMELKGDTTDYLYSPTETTFKDFYDSIAIKENVNKSFAFVFYDNAGFYIFPTTGTNYPATPVKFDDLASYKIPAYRSVILWHGEAMGVCRAGKVTPATGIGKLSEDYVAVLNANLKPLPKGWVLVPFGWNLDNVEILKAKLSGHISSMWFKAGGGDSIKVKGEGLDGSLLEEAIESTKTRSVWINMKKD